MPDSLYERDALAWSERQTDLLRRIAAGERLNEDVDWANVIEEIQDVDLGELHSCETSLVKAMFLLLQLRADSGSPDVPVWRCEALLALADAEQSFSPSMRQRINLQSLYSDSVWQVWAGAEKVEDRLNVTGICPFTLDDLLADQPDFLALMGRTSEA